MTSTRTRVGFAVLGHSEFHDDVWAWANAQPWPTLDPETAIDPVTDGWDICHLWHRLILAGCSVETRPVACAYVDAAGDIVVDDADHGDAVEDDVADAEVTFWFDGPIADLVRRLRAQDAACARWRRELAEDRSR